jgi:hypothetical protein
MYVQVNHWYAVLKLKLKERFEFLFCDSISVSLSLSAIVGGFNLKAGLHKFNKNGVG